MLKANGTQCSAVRCAQSRQLRPARVSLGRASLVPKASAHKDSLVQQSQERDLAKPALAALPLLLASFPAWAEDVPAPPPAPFSGFSALETALLFAPITTYAIFSIYREKINPKATISDLLLIIGFVIILGNILSIVFFKVRFF